MWYSIELLRTLAWLAVVVVLLAVFFRKPLARLVERIAFFSSPFISFRAFGQAVCEEREENHPPVASSPSQPFEDRPWNTFWLGHDMMWTVDVLLREAPKKHIQHGLRCCLRNLRAVGLGDSVQYNSIRQYLDEVTSMAERDLDRDTRLSFAQRTSNVLLEVGQKAKEHQTRIDSV